METKTSKGKETEFLGLTISDRKTKALVCPTRASRCPDVYRS